MADDHKPYEITAVGRRRIRGLIHGKAGHIGPAAEALQAPGGLSYCEK